MHFISGKGSGETKKEVTGQSERGYEISKPEHAKGVKGMQGIGAMWSAGGDVLFVC